MMNKKTLGTVIVVLVIGIMAGMIISLSNTNYELNTKLSENKQAFEEVSDEYEELVKGIHNKYEGNKYEIRYTYNDKFYIYTGNGKLFGETRSIIKCLK